MHKNRQTTNILTVVFILLFVSIAPGRTFEKEIAAWTKDINEQIGKDGKKSIAVIDFLDLDGNICQFGRFIAEEFSVELAGQEKNITVVDRMHLSTIMREHKLQMSDFVKQDAVIRLGRLAGADTLVTGTITPFGDSVRVAVKILDSETARVIGGITGNIAKTGAVEEMLNRKITSTGSSQANTTTQNSLRKTTETPLKKVKFGDFRMDIVQCRGSGTITIDLIITNTAKDDQYLEMGNNDCCLYDNFGNTYSKAAICLSNSCERSRNIQKLLISGVPTRASYQFPDVSKDATVIKRLDTRYKSSGEWSTVTFRDIPIAR